MTDPTEEEIRHTNRLALIITGLAVFASLAIVIIAKEW